MDHYNASAIVLPIAIPRVIENPLIKLALFSKRRSLTLSTPNTIKAVVANPFENINKNKLTHVK